MGWSQSCSILFHCSIDAAHKDISSIEPDSSSEEPEASHHGESVAKIEKGGNEIHNTKLQLEGKGQMRNYKTINSNAVVISHLMHSHRACTNIPFNAQP